MTFYRFSILCRHHLRRNRLLQILILTLIWAVADWLVYKISLPLPGSILGLFFVLTLLTTRRLNPASLRRGAEWFLAEMLLFFIPAIPSVLDHKEFLGVLGLKVLFVILMSTVMVMVVTALIVDFCFRWALHHSNTKVSHDRESL